MTIALVPPLLIVKYPAFFLTRHISSPTDILHMRQRISVTHAFIDVNMASCMLCDLSDHSSMVERTRAKNPGIVRGIPITPQCKEIGLVSIDIVAGKSSLR